MMRFVKPLLASVALCAMLPMQARAELDVIDLKAAIQTTVAGNYAALDALYKLRKLLEIRK